MRYPYQPPGPIGKFFGPIVFALSVIFRKCHILLFRYEYAFGHQAWNVEFFARKHFAERGRWPFMIGFQRRSYVANNGLLLHHKIGRVISIPKDSILNRLFRYGFAFQQEKFGRSWGTIGYRGIATATMSELHADVVSTQKCPVAFPIVGNYKAKAIKSLDSLGLKEGAYFCFQDRGREMGKERYTDSEDMFDVSRRFPIDSFYKGVEDLCCQNLTAVRIGAASGGEWKGPPIVDYAQKYRQEMDDYTDIVILAHCKFFVGPGSGVQLCVNAFNRPVCLVNAFPWPWTENPMREHSVVIPKKYWLKDEKRFLTIKEMVHLEKQFHWKKLYDPTSFGDMEIEVVANTSEEIAGAMVEINDRLDGCWDGPSYKLRDILEPHNLSYLSAASLGSTFVELNEEGIDLTLTAYS